MRQYHMISTKRMGWEKIYDYYPFPVDKFTKESALAMFCPVKVVGFCIIRFFKILTTLH